MKNELILFVLEALGIITETKQDKVRVYPEMYSPAVVSADIPFG